MFERRYLGEAPALDGEGEQGRFMGLAIRYNSRTAIGDPKGRGFYEEIAPGAVADALSGGDVRMLIDHDPSKVVSRTTAGSLALVDTADGVRVESALPEDLSYVKDLRANLRNGNVSGMSFGFTIPREGQEIRELEDGSTLRVVRQLKLFEVSAVTFPAYGDTEAMMRDELRAMMELPDEEEIVHKDAFAYRLRYLASRYRLPTAAKGE